MQNTNRKNVNLYFVTVHLYSREQRIRDELNGIVPQRRQEDPIPDWVKAENIEEFKRQLEIHCSNDDEKMHFKFLRRKWKNRVKKFICCFHIKFFNMQYLLNF